VRGAARDAVEVARHQHGDVRAAVGGRGSAEAAAQTHTRQARSGGAGHAAAAAMRGAGCTALAAATPDTHLLAIFSRPLSSVCTCHSFTSLSSGLAWMWVLATHSSCFTPDDCSCISSTAISATLSCVVHRL
jgi:hypothetical protein